MTSGSQSLQDKVALVTGGSRGIGKATSLALAKAGARVAVNYKSRAVDAETVCAEIRSQGGHAVAVQADVAIAAQVAEIVRQIESQLGPVGILVNNAGISRLQPFDQIGEQVWDEVLAVNLKSVFLVTQAVLPGMREKRWGRIINISSVAAQTGGVIGPHYAASKAGNRPFCWRAVCPHNRRILQATSPNDNTKALVATHAQPLYGILEGWPVVIIWPHGRKTVRGSPR